MTYGERQQRFSAYKPYKPHWSQRIGPIISKALTYAILVWYIAEITGNGQEIRLAVARGFNWSRYGVQYAIWFARKEML